VTNALPAMTRGVHLFLDRWGGGGGGGVKVAAMGGFFSVNGRNILVLHTVFFSGGTFLAGFCPFFYSFTMT